MKVNSKLFVHNSSLKSNSSAAPFAISRFALLVCCVIDIFSWISMTQHTKPACAGGLLMIRRSLRTTGTCLIHASMISPVPGVLAELLQQLLFLSYFGFTSVSSSIIIDSGFDVCRHTDICQIYGIVPVKKGELAESRLRVSCIALTHNLIWIMPTEGNIKESLYCVEFRR